jgi:hypothetical protein
LSAIFVFNCVVVSLFHAMSIATCSFELGVKEIKILDFKIDSKETRLSYVDWTSSFISGQQ